VLPALDEGASAAGGSSNRPPIGTCAKFDPSLTYMAGKTY
jgi:hypothetical protein